MPKFAASARGGTDGASPPQWGAVRLATTSRLGFARRAYKLGKKRWSYNQVELLLSEQGGSRRAVVTQAAAAAGGAKLPDAHEVRAACMSACLTPWLAACLPGRLAGWEC